VTAIDPDVGKWDAWRPEEAAYLLERVEAPWYVAGGWAIDLFLGGQRREHEDLETPCRAAGSKSSWRLCRTLSSS
jgi:hypothetical protein